MSKMNIGKQKVLNMLQDKFQYAVSSTTRTEYSHIADRNELYYWGIQWLDPKICEQLEKINATRFTTNIIKSTIDEYENLLLKARKRIGVSPTTNNEKDTKLAEISKYWIMNVQNQNNYSDYSMLKIKDVLKSGVGYSKFYFDDGKYVYEYCNPREVFPDPDDKSPKMDNQNIIHQSYYTNGMELINRYPKFEKHFNDLISPNTIKSYDSMGYEYSIPKMHDAVDFKLRIGSLENDTAGGQWVRGKSLRIVECYYKKKHNYYECIGITKPTERENNHDFIPEEYVFYTFNESLAKKHAVKITVKQGTRIYKGVYHDDLLLEHGPIKEQVPNQKFLPIVPLVLQRDGNGLYRGIIDDLISSQDLKNQILTTAMHYKDSRFIIAGGDSSMDQNKFEKLVTTQSRKKDGSIYLQQGDGSKIQIIEGSKALPHNMTLMEQCDKDYQRLTGLNDEYLGRLTRETSALAVQYLTLNTLNSQHHLIAMYESMLVSDGSLMIDTLRGTENINQLVKFYNLGTNKLSQINDEVSLSNFEIYADSAPNFSSSVEEEVVLFNELAKSQNPDFYLSSELRLKKYGFTDESAFELHQDWTRTQIEMQQIAMKAQIEMQQIQMEMQQQQDPKQQSQTKKEK